MNSKLKYILSLSAKFTYFESAKILYQRNQLNKIICGYPWFKLRNEGIPKSFISSHSIYNILKRPFLDFSYAKYYLDFLGILNKKNIDNKTLKLIEKNNEFDVLLGLAGVALKSGKKALGMKKIFVCERSSSEIGFQNQLLSDEYKSFNIKFNGTNKWFIETEQEEYEMADIILAPSNFVKNSFNNELKKKVKVINFGVNTDNFYKDYSIKKSDKFFDILFIGQISLRKGLHYLIDAFKKFNHPNKRLHVIGAHTQDKDFFKKKLNIENIKVYGHVNHLDLNKIINMCHVFVLPSIEEGFATVILQALSAGCPVIVSENTGAMEFVNENECGFVVPIRHSNAIKERLETLSEDKKIIENFQINALKKMKNQTWERYVSNLDQAITDYKNKKI